MNRELPTSEPRDIASLDEALFESAQMHVLPPVAGRSGIKPEKRKKLGWFFWLCVFWIGLNIFAALFCSLLPLQDPNYQPFANENMGPSMAHWFGTDETGRDIFSRVVYGARVSVIVGFGAMFFAFLIAGSLGMMAAYKRGRIDTITTGLMFTILAFPSLIFVIAVLSFWAPSSVAKLITVLAVVAIPLVYRVIRASTLSAATREYVTAAKVQGASDRRILGREILPNIAPTAISFLLIGIANVIVTEGGLAFLGLSAPPPTPSWGNMINESRDTLAQNIWLALFPSLAICLFLFSLFTVGDKLRAHFEVSEVKL